MECLIDGLARFLASSFSLAVQPSTAGLLLELLEVLLPLQLQLRFGGHAVPPVDELLESDHLVSIRGRFNYGVQDSNFRKIKKYPDFQACPKYELANCSYGS